MGITLGESGTYGHKVANLRDFNGGTNDKSVDERAPVNVQNTPSCFLISFEVGGFLKLSYSISHDEATNFERTPLIHVHHTAYQLIKFWRS